MTRRSLRSAKTAGGRKKTNRLEARLSKAQKELLQRAADARGQSLSEFVLRASEEAATRVLQESGLLVLAAGDQAAFVQALVSPPEPSLQLRAAAERHRPRLPGRIKE